MLSIRQKVFLSYVLTAVAVAVGALVLWLSVHVREAGFAFAYWVVVELIPGIIVTCWKDPLYLLALIISALFVWSFPWEWVFSGSPQADYYHPDPVLRGRRLTNDDAAGYRAYRQLVRRRNRRQQRST